ncbi:uncharacterized protein LOC114532742 [Dendronephthya gigantea]|uniref:uncharacterized protein LOC114532742 n=1 Tax=Dendronephthya gigantea TaxID=151771 RepID=UPI00106A58A9|nr:uncharacterized protein LOC114532742 [Dendronephthya gigantea]
MCSFNIVFPSPCKNCKGSDSFLSHLFVTLWKQLVTNMPRSRADNISTALPEQLLVPNEHLIQLLLPMDASETTGVKNEISETEWFNLAEVVHHSLLLDNLMKKLNAIKFNEFDYAEIIAEQLHNIADSKTDIRDFWNIYWLTCGHPLCIESSDNTPLHGALKRLEMWNQASITFVCPTNDLGESEFTDQWFGTHGRYVVDQDEKMPQDNNVVWKGCLECLANEQIDENWCLSRLSPFQPSSLQPSKDDTFSVGGKDEYILAEDIKVICEMNKDVVPFWRIFPSQFLLYHKSLLKRVFQVQETEGLDFEEICKNKENVILASIETYDRKYSVRTKSTKDWIEFMCSGSEGPQNEKLSKRRYPVNETFYLALYPVEAGIFLAYFLRADDAFIELQSLLAVYQAIFPSIRENTAPETSSEYEECQERKWLQLLDLIESSQRSPLKSEFSLAVHLDASEMLKHFTRDGKPMKKELKSLLKKIEEKQLVSTMNQKETEESHGRKAGVEYCSDKALSSTIGSFPRLLPKHETLSICNTPKTLARAKLHDVKRRVSKSETSSINVDTDAELDASMSQNIPLEQLEKSTKITRQESSKRSSTDEKILNATRQEQAKRKRRSFDANETDKPEAPDAKEKRSDRHKRRLARVVKRCLLKYGVDPTETYFPTCSERLYYLCKSFLQDLKTSEGLNDEMKRLAESNVATVVEFEKRQHASKIGGKAKHKMKDS